MSRFYSMLREASRVQPVKPAEQEPTGTPEAVPPVIAAMFDEAGTAADAMRAAAADRVGGSPTQSTPEPDLNITPEELLGFTLFPQNGDAAGNRSFGTAAKLTFDRHARVLPHAMNSVVVECYRRLRTKILQQHAIRPFRSLLISSSAPQEGKTVTTLNLALSFAMLPSFKVLVIDGDLRRGAIANWLGMENDHPGLSDLIEGSAEMNDVILRGESTAAHFMLRGKSAVPPAELLHSPKLSSYFRQMAEHYDLILVDSAPLNFVADSQLLAAQCDAVLLVARAFRTNRKSLEKAVEDLKSFSIIGTILNGADRTEGYGQYYGYNKP